MTPTILSLIAALVALVFVVAFVPTAQDLVKKLGKIIGLIISVIVVTLFFGFLSLVLRGLHWILKFIAWIFTFCQTHLNNGANGTWSFGTKINGKLKSKLG